MREVDRMETKREEYRTLREVADGVEQNPAPNNVDNYDALVRIGDEVYGVSFDDQQGFGEDALRRAGAEVYGARKTRGSVSGGQVSEDLQNLTVREAAQADQGIQEILGD